MALETLRDDEALQYRTVGPATYSMCFTLPRIRILGVGPDRWPIDSIIQRRRNVPPPQETSSSRCAETPAVCRDFKHDLLSESLSEGATRGVFGWLRANGYPLSERDIYQHSWIDLESTEDELDDDESDMEIHRSPKSRDVEGWLEGIE